MSLIIKTFEFFKSKMGINLRGREPAVPEQFLDGTYLFAVSKLGEMESEQFRDSQVNKGVLPIPKFDLTIQKDYHTLIHNQAEMACILTNARQFDAIRRAYEAIVSSMKALKLGYTPDAVLTDVETAMEAIGEVTGATVREDITSRIFERFCVGK